MRDDDTAMWAAAALLLVWCLTVAIIFGSWLWLALR
jgi:hypothetical protein